MASQPQTEQVQQAEAAPRWSLSARVAFRFCVLYFGLFSLTTQVLPGMFPIPGVDVPGLAGSWPVRPVVFWTAAHMFGVAHPLVYTGSGSGDKTFDWVLAFCTLVAALAGTAVWSALDRRRPNYVLLNKWFRLFLRFALGSEMLLYGIDKVVPLQMPFPYLTRLLEPYGNFSPMGVLWSSVGASTSYEIFVGSAEALGGILVMIPRTAMLGALVCLADVVEVFTLNMTYDVPVKLFSFHLILMCLFLLAPEASRLARFFFSRRPVEPSQQPPLCRTPRANRMAVAAQCVFAALLLAGNIAGARKAWLQFGGGRPRPQFYGIWNIDDLSVDGATQPAARGGPAHWRRAIFDFPGSVAFQEMNDSFSYYAVSIDNQAGMLSLTPRQSKTKATFHFERPSHGELVMDGRIDGHQMQLRLHLMDRNKFPLVSRGFHWIQEYPYNR